MRRMISFETFLSGAEEHSIPKVTVLHGLRGSGKEYYADKLARKFVKDSDYLKYYPVKYNFSVEQSREVVTESMRAPRNSPLKFIYLTGFSYMGPEASNALLKSLEDNFGSQTRFLLACDSLEDMLPTIVSRSVSFYIPPFTQEEVSAYLVDYHAVEESRAVKMAKMSRGNLDQAKVYALQGSPRLSVKWSNFLNLLSTKDLGELSDTALMTFSERTTTQLLEWIWFWHRLVGSDSNRKDLILDVYKYSKWALQSSYGPMNTKLFSRTVVQSLHKLFRCSPRDRKDYMNLWGVSDV